MSAEAAEMRREIEDLAASGNSEAAIIAHYKAQYGERILVIPDGGTGRVLFILPPIAIIVLGTILILALRRMRRAEVVPALGPIRKNCSAYGVSLVKSLSGN